MGVTIGDVAREAGVSTATVSRVINNQAVREVTRAKVLDAMEALNWEPNPAARALMTGKGNTVGVVIPSLTNPYFSEIVESMESCLTGAGYLSFLVSVGGDRSEEKERQAVETLVRRRVDGIVVVDGTYENNHNGFFTHTAESLPLVVINGFPGLEGVDLVMTDQARGMVQVLDYLYGLGHGRIAFLRAEEEASADVKLEAFWDWHRSKALAVDPELTVSFAGVNRSRISGETEEAVCRWISSLERRPTALFACNELMALGALRGLEKAGLAVPRDISLVGHDNTPYAALVKPALTTVEMNMAELGAAAARRMVERLEGGEQAPRRILFSPELIVRESTARAPGGKIG
ncbi:MAG: LacI family DNA-binding transcriptional regulator [Spirochaetales bacterium]|nr:LacI family DNA-binding transcriptional regulator [Spirochaetales bacterium]